LRFLP